MRKNTHRPFNETVRCALVDIRQRTILSLRMLFTYPADGDGEDGGQDAKKGDGDKDAQTQPEAGGGAVADKAVVGVAGIHDYIGHKGRSKDG